MRKSVKSNLGKLSIALIIILQIVLTFYVGLTRVQHNMHHALDVAISLAVDFLIAITWR